MSENVNKKLPEGWRWVKLGEVCEFIRGVSFDKSEMSTIPYHNYKPILRAGNIKARLITDDDLVWVSPEAITPSQYLQVSDIAICMSSGSPTVVGKTAYCENDFDGSVGAFCGIIRANHAIDAKYLSHWLRSGSYESWRDSQARGANIQNLRFSEIVKIDLPLPPLPTQQRLATLLNDQLAAVERLRLAAQAQLNEINALPAALLRQAFNGE